MASSMIDALLSGARISKHEGPGPHSTGTSQKAHAGRGTEAWASALNTFSEWRGVSGALSQAEDLERRFGDAPGWARFKEGIREWSSGGQRTSRLLARLDRGGADDPDVWRPSDSRLDSLRLLGRTVANAPQNAPRLFRGITLEGSSLREMFSEGAEFSDVGLGSWTTDDDFARRWANPRFAKEGQLPTVFVLDQGSRALNIAPLAELPDQQEWITGGTFRVSRIDDVGGRVFLKQVEAPKQRVRKRDDRNRYIEVALSGRPDALYEVSKHEGPGPHPGTGSPQDVHSGGQPGTESGAITTPFGLEAFSPQVQKRIEATIEKRMREENVDLEESTLVGHLRGLWDRARKEDPDGFERARLWYPGAKEYGTAVGEAFGADERQAAGVLAALSPQTGWGRNQDMAADLMGLLFEDPVVGASRTSPARLSELSPKMAARFLSGLTHPELRVQTGKRKGEYLQLFDQSEENIAKAISLYRGDDPDDVLGNGPKVRSFFNNILLPDRKTSWTDDTHMRRIWLQDPDISNDDPLFRRIFGRTPTIKDEYDRGWGTYPYFASVGNRAADELGVLPHEVQAVTWTRWREETGVTDRDERRGMSDLDQAIEQLSEPVSDI